METIFQNGVYKHYKGGIYKTVCLGVEESTGRAVVVYGKMGTSDYFTRPIEEFRGLTNDGQKRFTYVCQSVGSKTDLSLTSNFSAPIFFDWSIVKPPKDATITAVFSNGEIRYCKYHGGSITEIISQPIYSEKPVEVTHWAFGKVDDVL